MDNLWLILVALTAYLLGSISPAYLISRFVLKEKNLSEFATGNLGAMNVFRSARSPSKGYSVKKAGVLLVAVIAADAAKAYAALAIAKYGLLWLGYNETAGLAIAAALVVVGHNCSLHMKLVFRKFCGGRGISCALGIALFCSWPFALVGFCAFLAIIWAGELVEYLLRRKSGWKMRRIDRLLGSQIPGRMAGLAIVLAAGYFLMPRGHFLALLAGSLPMFLAHISKVRQYFPRSSTSLAPD